MSIIVGILGFLLVISAGFRAAHAYDNGRDRQLKLYAGLAALGIVAIFFPAVIQRMAPLSAPASATTVAVEADQVARREAIIQGMGSVQAVLKDGWSARFTNTYAKRAREGFYASCGLVNAKNSFGAYAGPQRFIAFLGVAAVDTGDYQFENQWRTYCAV